MACGICGWTAVLLTCVSLVLISRSSPVSNLTEKTYSMKKKNCGKKLTTIWFFQFIHVWGGHVWNTNLSQAVSFAEGLVGHVFKLLWDRTWTPSGWVVLDHGGVELGHGLKSEWRRLQSPNSYIKVCPDCQIIHDIHLLFLHLQGLSLKSSTDFSSNALKQIGTDQLAQWASHHRPQVSNNKTNTLKPGHDHVILVLNRYN